MAPFTPALVGARLRPVSLLLRGAAVGSRITPPCSLWAVPCRRRAAPLDHHLLKQWTVLVSPYSSLQVEVPCHVRVVPQDPVAHPKADQVFVTVSGIPKPEAANLEDLEVKYDQESKSLRIQSKRIDSQTRVEVGVPAGLDIDIKAFGIGSVKVQRIECESCNIETEKGSSIIQSLKSYDIHVQTKGGNVVGVGTVLGNLDIKAAEKSTVNLEKLQGDTINISTEDGMLITRYLYAESSFLSSAAGDIALGSIHGDITVETKRGNISVDSCDGSLNACTHQGAIDVYITKLGKVDLQSDEGSITVKVPTTLTACLELSGTEIDVAPDIQLEETKYVYKDGQTMLSAHLNTWSEGEQSIQACSKSGRVSLQLQNWFQSLRLEF